MAICSELRSVEQRSERRLNFVSAELSTAQSLLSALMQNMQFEPSFAWFVIVFYSICFELAMYPCSPK